MKLNWGTGIVIAFGLFISFILYFVLKVQSNPEYDNELVVENYYVKDTRYGEELAQMQAAEDSGIVLEYQSKKEGIRLQFPVEVASQISQGKVSLYRPSGKNLDFVVPLALSGDTLLIPDSRLAGGRWDITVNASVNGKPMTWKKTLYR